MSLRARIYSLKGLLFGVHESSINRDPFAQFKQWYGQACRTGLPLPNSFTLATVTPDGKPDARMLLLKGVDEKGFVFYTNYESRKADEIAKNPNATMVFHRHSWSNATNSPAPNATARIDCKTTNPPRRMVSARLGNG